MDCKRAIREETVERYLAGTLDAQAREEWELHYFGCDVCADRLENFRAIRESLVEMAPQIRREMRPQRTAPRWWWIALPLAAAMVLLFVISLDTRHPQQSAVTVQKPDFTLLAKLDPPAYNAPVLRGVDSPAENRFRQAMTAYQAHDWPHAIEGLQRSLELDPNAAAPRFFLGASYLLAGNAQPAAVELERVASMDSPFRDEARFDLAKAYLALNRPDDAIASLWSCGAEFAAEARSLITRIQDLRK